MLISIIDTETNGLDPEKHQAIELAVVLYDSQSRCIVACGSELLPPLQGYVHGAEEIHGIPESAFAASSASFSDELQEMVSASDFGTGWNAEFDLKMLGNAGVVTGTSFFDAMDLRYPKSTAKRQSLIATALAHGIGVGVAHRAIHDTLLLAELFRRSQEMGMDLGAEIERALQPKVEVVSTLPREQNETNKAHGFRWDPNRKVWARMMFADEVAALPFKTRTISKEETCQTE